MKTRDLKDTISLMTSDDYKDRLLAEYWQLKLGTKNYKSL